MSSFNLSPNMSLPVPIPGTTLGPDFATDLNSSLTIIDSHDHTPGSGVQITASAINLTTDLPFNGNNATTLRTVRFSSQAAALSGASDVGCLYEAGNELYFNDGLGNQVQMTTGGLVNATSSGISSGTASASFVSSILTVVQSAGVGAAIDAASYVLRYNGSYPSPSGNSITLRAPASLATTYHMTFPVAAAVSDCILGYNSAGSMFYVTPDANTIQFYSVTGGLGLKVGAASITTSQISATAGILGSQLSASAGITGDQIANLTVTNANISGTANIEGEKLISSPNFQGVASVSLRNIVVSNTNAAHSISIIRTYVSVPSPVSVVGEGATVTRTATGRFTLTWTTAFTDIPTLVVSIINVSPLAGSSYHATITTLGTTSASIAINDGTNFVDMPFTFIVAGQRN